MKKYLSGIYMEQFFLAEWDGTRYKCIPQYSKGNGTDMTFFAKNESGRHKPQFHDTLEEALGNKIKHNNRQLAIREEQKLRGY